MEAKVMLEKILRWGEFSPAEQIEALGLIRARATESESFDFLMKRNLLSAEEKIELLGKLVSESAQKIILEEYLIASMWVKEKVDVTLRAKDCKDPDTNISKFLRILGAQDVQVSSDFPCWYAWENYEGTTRVRFRV